MNVLRAIKVAELRKKLAIIPAKIILAVLIFIAVYVLRHLVPSLKEFSFSEMFGVLKADWIAYLALFIAIYGAVSYFCFFIDLLKIRFVGLALAVAIAAGVYLCIGRVDSRYTDIAILALLLLGPFVDIINMFRYGSLKRKVIKTEEQLLNAGHNTTYDDGFEEGFKRGMNEGRLNNSGLNNPGINKSGLNDSGRRPVLARAPRIKSDEDYYGIEDQYEDGYPEDEYPEDEYPEGEYPENEYSGDEYSENAYSGDEYSGNNYYEDNYSGDYYEGSGYAGTGNEAYGKAFGEERHYISGDSGNIAGYFADCRDAKEVKRRYHDLCKVYHPDAGNVSSDIFYRINEEYQSLMNRLQ